VLAVYPCCFSAVDLDVRIKLETLVLDRIKSEVVIVDRINSELLFLIGSIWKWLLLIGSIRNCCFPSGNKGAIVLAQAGLAAYVMFLLLYLHKSVTVRVVFL
jgi:hypothetical protein